MRTRTRAATFAIVGLLLGVLCVGWAFLVYLVRGPLVFEQLGASVIEVSVVYLLVGPIGGIVLALAWPITRWIWGAALAGMLTVAPLYAGCFALLLPRQEWFPLGVVAGTIVTVLIGGTTGVWAWWDEYGGSKRSRRA